MPGRSNQVRGYRFRVATVAHARFYAFDLVRELINQDADCTLLTNYPRFVCARFGVPSNAVRSLVSNGVAIRALQQLQRHIHLPDLEPATHTWFSRWAGKELADETVDVVQCFSGVAEDVFRHPRLRARLRVLVRGSAHIADQFDLLSEEEDRTGAAIAKPSQWRIQRELREYALADLILVLSSFARQSFLSRGVDPSKVAILPLGAELARFRPSSATIAARVQRIRSGAPLRVLMVGTFAYQKGALDFSRIASTLQPRFKFRFVGTLDKDAELLARASRGPIEFISYQQHEHLSSQYDWADLFVFPTIHDGYAVVIAQALANRLVVIASSNSGAPDLIVDGQNGWTLPIRSPQLYIDRLEWCALHRNELAGMIEVDQAMFLSRDWSDVARDFRMLCEQRIRAGKPRVSG